MRSGALSQHTSEREAGPSDPTSEPAGSGGGRLGAVIGGLVRMPAGTPWHRQARIGLGLVVLSTVLTLVLGAFGSSVITLNLGPRDSWLPAWYLPASAGTLAPWAAAILGYLIVILGAAGTWICLRALAGGWKPRVRPLYVLGVVLNLVTILVPPMSSADSLMYSAYGRMVQLGFDPYTQTPAQVFRIVYDPVMRWTERPWQDTVNVYGPLLYWIQYGASVLGGGNMHDTVFWLQVVCCLAFIIACSLVLLIARGDVELQRRVLIWTLLSPMLIWAVVAGAHNEAVSLAVALCGLLCIRRYPFLTGLLIGIACTGKATVGLYGIGMAWAYRRELKKFVLSMIGAAIPNVLAYIIIYPQALKGATQNASYVHSSSWLFPVMTFLKPFLVGDVTEKVISVLAWGSAVLIGWMLSRVLPWRSLPGAPQGVGAERDPLAIAVRTITVVSAGWVFTAASSLAWYDLIYALPMALIGATKLDLIALLRMLMLNIGYVLGRVLNYPPVMMTLTNRLKETGSATAGVGVLVVIVLWWHEHGLKVGSHTRAPHEGDPPEGELTAAPASTSG